jgi:hypothetical protein
LREYKPTQPGKMVGVGGDPHHQLLVSTTAAQEKNVEILSCGLSMSTVKDKDKNLLCQGLVSLAVEAEGLG